MPLTIDQIDAQVEPPPAPGAPPAARKSGEDEPETEQRRHCDLHARIAVRAARLRAD
jgi:hypothetical protein